MMRDDSVTSIVVAREVRYVKFPVLKSDLRLPIERTSFALSTFSFISGCELEPT
jgi:hypothetical protein